MQLRTPASKTETPAPSVTRRQKRADALRKRALSPVRILLMVVMLPVSTIGIAAGVYLRTSEFEHDEAMLHLIALAGCDAVENIVPGPFVAGRPGYHTRNDPDGDGVACDTHKPSLKQSAPSQQVETTRPRTVGNAKFVRP